MKKVLFLYAFICTTNMAVFCQNTDSTISEAKALNLVRQNASENRNAGVKNIDSIYEGQVLSYNFVNGKHSHMVRKDEYQIQIVQDMEKLYGKRIMRTDTTSKSGTGGKIQPGKSEASFDWQFWLLMLILVISTLGIILSIQSMIKKHQKKKSNEPEVLHPVIEGGVSDADAPNYADSLIRNMGPNFHRVGESLKVRITSINKDGSPVLYREGWRFTFFDKFVCFQTHVRIDGKKELKKAYYVQPCGNDAGIIEDKDILIEMMDQPAALVEANKNLLQRLQTMEKTADAPQVTEETAALINAMTQILANKKNGMLTITAKSGQIFELLFSEQPIGFSKNGNSKNLPAATVENVEMH